MRILSQHPGQQVYQRAMVHCSPSALDDTYTLVVSAVVDNALRTLVNIDLREVESIVMRNRATRLFTVHYRQIFQTLQTDALCHNPQLDI